MNTICLNISDNIVTISNNKYIINDISNITTYGLFVYDASISQSYYLQNIPRNAPLRFFIDGCNNNTSDISHIVEVSYNGPTIPIYVSKGNDISFNNGDYFRFYDESFNLININHNSFFTNLTNSGDNFYFMNDVSYKFIAISDFSSSSPFSISGNGISSNIYELLSYDDSFIINISGGADNSSNKIFYIDLCNQNISGDLFIAKDNSNNKYYYDNIRFSIKPEISNNDISLSIISRNQDISNINFFKYDESCNYIINNTNIIANELSKEDQECLNIISQADFSNGNFYELNVGNHFSGNDNINNISDLSYVIYDGTYYIFDICINYPIKVNNNSSDVLLIDPNYIYTEETDDNYYWNAIKLIVNISGIEINNTSKLFILDVSNSSNSITFIYSDKCTYPDSVNGRRDRSRSRFNLINQNYTEFSDNFYQPENRYSLNIYENFIEPSNNYGFIAFDEYENNLTDSLLDGTKLIISNAPSDLSSILTRTNNYDISNFLITYILTTYDEQELKLYRFVEINYGPFIEISATSIIYYNNDNSFSNIINISYNQVSPFDLSNIIVYLKTGYDDTKIFLDFDVEFLNNSYYDINSTNKQPIKVSNLLLNDISYNKNVKFPNDVSGKNFYLSRNLLHFNYKQQGSNELDQRGNLDQARPFILKDISNLTIDNSSSTILNDKFIISFFNQDRFLNVANSGSITYNELSGNSNKESYKYLTFFSKIEGDISFTITNIVKDTSYMSISFDLIELTQTDVSNENINTKLYLNNEQFVIDFSFLEPELSANNVTLSGNFIEPFIFGTSSIDTSYIDTSYIGNYQIKIVPLGLKSDDNFYNTFSNDISFLNLIQNQDVSKIYTINVIDKSNPTIDFCNSVIVSSTTYEFKFPKDLSFNLIPRTNDFISNSLFFLSDACYTDFINLNRENSSKPIIVFNDNNSIYNVDLSYQYQTTDLCNINVDNINHVLDVSNINQDASAVIQYIGIDLCGNQSNTISLTIKFQNIPQLTLSGLIVIDFEVGVDHYYKEPGIIIDTGLYNFNDLSLTGPFTDFCNNIQIGNKQYDISFIASDLCLNQVGLYDISYIVSFSDDSTTTYLRRIIKVQDTTPPFILFRDLSSINYDFSSRDTNNISNTLSSLSDISYVKDRSNNPIIDFSLSLFSHISDLSKIIYDFSLVDNYSNYSDISVSISLEIISITGDISSIDFKQDLNNIITFLSGYGYINADGSFIILTQSSDYDKDLSYSYYKPELSFNYIINDICDNSFNFTRKLNIINYDISPNIFFTRDSSAINDLSNRNIVIYDISKINFSYQAHSYIKDPSAFIHEISNILFNFDISDQFSQIHNIDLNSNILISISYNDLSYNDPSIISLNDLTNLNDNCFNDVSNYYVSISNILEQFSKIDNSFQLIYDFSNNQNLSNTITRDVTIINTISCDISVNFSFPGETTTNTINISFGNTDFSFTKFFTLSHPRLEDVSFELSYNAYNAGGIQYFSSIIGDVSFDVSALIYQYTQYSNIKRYNFQFYNTIQNSTFDSSIIDISINIKIDPPFLKNDSPLSTITHNAGTYISDLSLIENVSFFSKFDEFYYYNNPNNYISISYSETNFTLSFEKIDTTSVFDQNFPRSDFSGDATYNIIYDAIDANDISISFKRTLIIEDKTPPIITLKDQDPIDVNDFLQSQSFKIAGFSVQDSFSYLKTIDYSVEVIIDSSVITTLDICNFDLTPNISNIYDIPNTYNLNYNDISNFADDFSDITIRTNYKATDIKDNSTNDISSSITFNFSDLINLNISILYQGNYFSLSSDFYIPRDDSDNWFLKYNHSAQTITYDASTNDISFIVSVDSSNVDTNIKLNNSIQIIPSIDDIDFIDICNIDLYFQLFYLPNTEDGDPIIRTRILNLNIIDKSDPVLSFINNNTEIFSNIYNIKLPEVSDNLISEINNNLNFLFDKELSYNYFIKNESGNLIYNIPSIKIKDNVNGLIIVPNNIDDISNINSNKYPNDVNYDISISYYDLCNNYLSHKSSSDLLTDLSKQFIQNFNVIENTGNDDFSINRADISRNIIIEKFKPFINITYNNNYKKSYHKLYSIYRDLGAVPFDYYDGSSISIETLQTINENEIGIQEVKYRTINSNNQTFNISRQVHVVDICCIFFNRTINYDISSISNDFNSNIRYGLYGSATNDLSYNFYIDPLLNTYIALKSYKNDTIFDNSNAISINNNIIESLDISNVYYNYVDDCSYVKGNVIINIKQDFDRASLYWIRTDSSGIFDSSGNFTDLFLYHDSCIYYIIDNEFIDICNSQIIEFSVNVSGENNIGNINVPYFTLSGNHSLSNELTFEPTPRKTLHLPFGTYRFKQNKFKNFYNKIKFSYLPDGCHFNIQDNSNGDISYIYDDFLLYNNYNSVKEISFNDKNDISYSVYEYTNNVYSNSLAGINMNNRNNYTYLEINATTPSPLYYYSENFSNMGGIIYSKNNISFSKKCVSLNGNILAIDNCNGNIFNHTNFTINNTNFNEISNNLLFLACRFDLSAITPSITNNKIINKDFIALTQQNITHNIIINKDSNKIIFKKYDDISSINNGTLSSPYETNNYIIKEDNSNNYLFDSSINFIQRHRGNNVLLYKFDIDTSVNLIGTNTINQRLELNVLDFFFNNNELKNNYNNFFNKNKLINNIYKKYNNRQPIYFLKDNFKYNINEIDFINQIQLINGDTPYLYYENKLLNSNRLIFEPIFDNKFIFNFQIYLDYNNINLDTNYKNYLKNNIFNKNIYSNYAINNDLLFFDELIISIISDISGTAETITDFSQSIIFSENTIFINERFLDSSNNKDTIDNALDGIDISSENLIILSAIDDSNNTFCGLTQQNFVHNINTSYDNKVIFHKYDFSINNYQANDNNLSLKKTLLNNSNNNKYFIELSNNDVYNCFIDICENISQSRNVVKKNRLMEASTNILDNENFSFNTHITYTIYDEIENNNNYLNKFDIRPKNLYELNELSYNNTISYAYANYNDISNSHSFVINLTDYLDRNFFNNIKIKIPHNIINYNFINFIIKDISYSDQTKQFNLYDISANQIILYDKSKIAILNNLEAKIHITNFKFLYLITVYKRLYAKTKALTDFTTNTYNFINTLNLQNITTLYEDFGFITNTYAVNIESDTLNRLYSNVFYNSKLLFNRYRDLLNVFKFYDYFLLPNTPNVYENMNNYDLVDQLETDISLIIVNIEKINDENVARMPSGFLNSLNSDLSLNKFTDYDTLLDLTQFYINHKRNYEIIHYELNLRHSIHGNIDNCQNNLNILQIYDSSFDELFNTYEINDYYGNLINNMINFNNMLLHDISSSVIYMIIGSSPNSLNNYLDNTDNYNGSIYHPLDISYLKILKNDISSNFNTILTSANTYYDFITKETIFNDINYVLNGSSIFINAFKSTNILFKIDLIYNSYLFKNVYLDTLVLDIIKPDLNPPTLIFNDPNLIITGDELLYSSGSIGEETIKKLIQDISYIELHETDQNYQDFDFTDISYFYIGNDINIIPFDNFDISSDITITIDFSNTSMTNQQIIYSVTDKAGNNNIIYRNVIYIPFVPTLYYVNSTNGNIDPDNDIIEPDYNNSISVSESFPPLVIPGNLNDNSIIDFAKNNIFIKDVSGGDYISKEDSEFNEMLTITIINTYIIRYTLKSLAFPNIPDLKFHRLYSKTGEITEEIKDHCCYPPAFYHPIQHNYTLGQNATYKMRFARFIINNHR